MKKVRSTAPRKSVSPYVVYIDESFFNFWGLNNPDGNFCYVAFGVPQENLSILDVEHKRLIDLFQTAVASDLGETPPVEIKSVVFRRLELKSRRRIALLARGLMLRLGAFFLTEFCQVRGFILESVRSDLLEKGDSQIPEKWDSLYQAKRDELSRAVKEQKLGQSPLLQKLIETPTASLAYFLTQRAKWYELVVDPRGGVEDNYIAKTIQYTTEAVIRGVHRESPDKLRATSFSTRSENCPGLQMADLLAGEVRHWFVRNPEFLEFNSGLTLLDIDELQTKFYLKTSAGIVSKPERRTNIPFSLSRKLYRAGRSSLFPYFRSSLANNLISCIAAYGEFRHIDLAHDQIIDSPDNR
jgi:Protein of unknown function (DUF3800)